MIPRLPRPSYLRLSLRLITTTFSNLPVLELIDRIPELLSVLPPSLPDDPLRPLLKQLRDKSEHVIELAQVHAQLNGVVGAAKQEVKVEVQSEEVKAEASQEASPSQPSQ